MGPHRAAGVVGIEKNSNAIIATIENSDITTNFILSLNQSMSNRSFLTTCSDKIFL